jgi:hypothetical protein
MAAERQSGCSDLPGDTTPQASMKLSLPRWGPALPRRGPLPRPHHHCPLVWATGTAGADSMAGTGDGPAPCG